MIQKYDITFVVFIITSNVKKSMMKSQGSHLYPINIFTINRYNHSSHSSQKSLCLEIEG